MDRDQLADMAAFAAVAEARSFTRAAQRLGMSQSALSQIVRRLEERLGLRLLARTTRSVAPTQSGEKLLETLAPMLRELEGAVAALGEMREHPAGLIRITAVEHATRQFLVPAMARFLPDHPDIAVEIEIDYGLTDIVAARFDAGVRLGEQVEKDMIALRISPPVPMAIVASPDYLAGQAVPDHPRDLTGHRCINLRMPTSGTDYVWQLAKRGKAIRVRTEGQITLNALDPIIDAALAGLGIANLPLDLVETHLATGRLKRVLADWSADLPAYHLYYPNRRHASPAFRLFLEAVRFRGCPR